MEKIFEGKYTPRSHHVFIGDYATDSRFMDADLLSQFDQCQRFDVFNPFFDKILLFLDNVFRHFVNRLIALVQTP